MEKKEADIIREIGVHRRFLTINEIAVEINLSWATVRKYLLSLLNEGLVTKKGGKYQIDYEVIYGSEEVGRK